MTREEIEELKGLAASMGLYDDKNPCKRAVILGKAIEELEQESCEDCISRAEVKRLLDKGWRIGVYPRDAIIQLPRVKPEPKTGHWTWCGGSHKCSNCGEYTCFSHKEMLRYCPNCGAKMEG